MSAGRRLPAPTCELGRSIEDGRQARGWSVEQLADFISDETGKTAERNSIIRRIIGWYTGVSPQKNYRLALDKLLDAQGSAKDAPTPANAAAVYNDQHWNDITVSINQSHKRGFYKVYFVRDMSSRWPEAYLESGILVILGQEFQPVRPALLVTRHSTHVGRYMANTFLWENTDGILSVVENVRYPSRNKLIGVVIERKNIGTLAVGSFIGLKLLLGHDVAKADELDHGKTPERFRDTVFRAFYINDENALLEMGNRLQPLCYTQTEQAVADFMHSYNEIVHRGTKEIELQEELVYPETGLPNLFQLRRISWDLKSPPLEEEY